MKVLSGISLEAQKLHRQAFVIDLHADTLFLVFRFGYDLKKRHRNPFPLSPLFGHVDIPRMRAGGVTAMGFSLPSVPLNIARRKGAVIRQLEKVVRWAGGIRSQLVQVRSASEIVEAREKGIPSFFLTLEGAHGIPEELEELKRCRKMGLLSVTLAHITRCPAAYPSTFGRWKGKRLPQRGLELVEKMEEAGMVVDLAHMGGRPFIDAIGKCTRPPFVSHTGLYGVKPMWRNITDYEVKLVADKGGVVGVIFYPGFLSRSSIGSLDCVVANIEYLLKIVGDDFIALGSDFDGWVPSMPRGLSDVSYLPRLTENLLRAGIPADSVRKIIGANALRVIREVTG